MRTLKKFAVLAVAVFAVSVVGVASASASQFTASEVGQLEGTQEGNQTFTASSSSPAVVCEKAHTTGEIKSKAAEKQEVTVLYSSCSIPSILGASVENITATYELNANGSVKIVNNILIHVPFLGCTTTVTGGQTVSSASYDNITGGTLRQTSAVTGIHSTAGFPCPSGTTGTYSGTNVVHRVGGGTISWDM